MKQQTFIARLEDENGHMIEFERFYCKRASTVKRQMDTYWKNVYRIFKDDKVSFCAIYATPDGYNECPVPVLKFRLADHLKIDLYQSYIFGIEQSKRYGESNFPAVVPAT